MFIRPHKKKRSCFSSPPSSLLGAASLFFIFFFYKNADNALEIELNRSKIEMPLSFLKDFYTWNMFRHVFVQIGPKTYTCMYHIEHKKTVTECAVNIYNLKRVDLDRSLAKKKKKPSLPHQILKNLRTRNNFVFLCCLMTTCSSNKLIGKKYTSSPRYWYMSIGQYYTIFCVPVL